MTAIIVLTGAPRVGKTTTIMRLAWVLKERGVKVGGIVSSQRDGRYTKYHLKDNIKDIVDLLKSYYPSVWSKLSFRLAELFVDLADKSKPDDENAELFVDLADKSKPERDDDHPVLNDKNEQIRYEVGKGGENKDSIWNKIEL